MRAIAVACLAPLALLLGCPEDPAFLCQSDDVCLLNDVQGTCQLATGTCVYPSGPECNSMLMDANGECVDTGPASTSGSESDGSATSTTTGDVTSTTSTPGSSETTDSATTTPVTATDSATGTDTEAGGCDQSINLTDLGVVGASTVFSGYPPILSVDGDQATSWFSTGPEAGDAPSVYTWTASEEHCISRIFISGNGMNSNPEFREGFGFESMEILIFNDANDMVFEEQHSLPGTPDPEITSDTGGVIGSRVVLMLSEHENESCGGFSELQVLGD